MADTEAAFEPAVSVDVESLRSCVSGLRELAGFLRGTGVNRVTPAECEEWAKQITLTIGHLEVCEIATPRRG